MQNYYRCNNKTYAKQKQRKTKQVIKHKIGNAKITEETRENAIGKANAKSKISFKYSQSQVATTYRKETERNTKQVIKNRN